MPTDVVKNIKIGDVSRPIAATYDAENDTAIHSKYLKLTAFYPTNEDGTLDTSASLYMKTSDADSKYRTTTDSYTKTETDGLLTSKADTTNVYTKSETDNLLVSKVDTTNTYTKTEADDKFADKESYQAKNLAQSITLDEIERTTVEGAIDGLVQGINATRADINVNYVKNATLKDSVSAAITELAEEGLIEVKTTQTKRISFRKGIQNLDLSKTDGFDQYLKVIIYDSSVSTDTISANIDLDYAESLGSGTRTPVNAGYLKTGAKYEIYKNVLVMENNMGDKTIVTSTQPQ